MNSHTETCTDPAKREGGNNGEHQIRYYGWYSNEKRGMREDEDYLVY